LLLASNSVWRRQMLDDAGLACDSVSPEIDEESIAAAGPVALALARAVAKAEAVAARHPRALVLGADQVAYLGDEVFGKPRDPEDHLRRLRQLRGRAHTLVTGVALRGPGVSVAFQEQTVIHFRSDLQDREIQAYVDSGEGSGCAGGYRVEAQGSWLIDRVEGDWFNVVGLPILGVIGALRALGWELEIARGP
jgi:septum formation protein